MIVAYLLSLQTSCLFLLCHSLPSELGALREAGGARQAFCLLVEVRSLCFQLALLVSELTDLHVKYGAAEFVSEERLKLPELPEVTRTPSSNVI